MWLYGPAFSSIFVHWTNYTIEHNCRHCCWPGTTEVPIPAKPQRPNWLDICSFINKYLGYRSLTKCKTSLGRSNIKSRQTHMRLTRAQEWSLKIWKSGRGKMVSLSQRKNNTGKAQGQQALRTIEHQRRRCLCWIRPDQIGPFDRLESWLTNSKLYTPLKSETHIYSWNRIAPLVTPNTWSHRGWQDANF